MSLDGVIDRLVLGIERALAYALIIAVLINFASVIGRYVFGRSVLGSDEIMIYLMVWTAFLGAVVVGWRHQHITMNLLAAKLPPWADRIRGLTEQALLTAITGFVAYHSAGYAWSMHALGRASDGSQIPMWIPHASVSIGFALMATIGALRTVRMLAGVEPRVSGSSTAEGAER